MSETEFPIKVREVRVKHKSGTIYVERRQYQYDPKRKHNVVLKSERIGKISPETGEIIPCRPKRKSASKDKPKKEADPTPESATRKKTGAVDLLSWAGRESGLESCVRTSYPDGATANKTLSVGRYLVLSGAPVNRIESWQLDHDLPYSEGMTPDVCYQLFEDLGVDEKGMQSLFGSLARLSKNNSPVLAFDSTTTSSYSKNLEPYVRQGFNKASDGLQTYKLVTFYSVFAHLPVSFELQPGNIADVTCMRNAVKRAQSYGLKTPEFIADSAFGRKNGILEMLRNHIQFTVRSEISDSWVGKCLDEPADDDGKTLREKLALWENACPFDHTTHGVGISRMVEFSWTRKLGRGDKAAGDTVKKSFRLYLHFYRNISRSHSQDESLKTQILTLRRMLEEGTDYEKLSAKGQQLVDKYLIRSRSGRGGKLHVALNQEALDDAVKNSGIFCLVSNKHKNPWVVLKRYRMRNRIEECYRVSKSEMDGERARVWSMRKVRGKELCRLVALGYHFYLQTAVNRVRSRAASLSQDQSLTQDARGRYDAVRKWIEKTPLSQILAWFDCVETVTVKNSVAQRRWTTETIKRDQLFLELLKDPKTHELTDEETQDDIPGESPD